MPITLLKARPPGNGMTAAMLHSWRTRRENKCPNESTSKGNSSVGKKKEQGQISMMYLEVGRGVSYVTAVPMDL